MRPNSLTSDFLNSLTFANFGLPQGGLDGYNHQQKLPVAARTHCACTVRGGAEFEMKRQVSQLTSAEPDADSRPGNSQTESRAERLARIQREIAAGTYETPDKLEAAVDRLMGVLRD